MAGVALLIRQQMHCFHWCDSGNLVVFESGSQLKNSSKTFWKTDPGSATEKKNMDERNFE